MKQATVQTVYDWLNEIAPFDTAEAYDNVGLLVGSLAERLQRVLVALDLTPAVLQEAIAKDVQLVVTHHPLMFHATKRILLTDYEGALIAGLLRHNISLISAHTNLDRSSVYSGSAALTAALNLQEVRQDDLLFVGTLPDAPVSADMLRSRIAACCEGGLVQQFGNGNAPITTLAVCGGAYDEGYVKAKELGAQAYLTGEVRHHNILAAMGAGMILYAGGHFGTENPLVPRLAGALQNALDALQYHVVVYPSVCRPYG